MDATAHLTDCAPRNRYVTAYEASGRTGPAVLAAFLPPRSDPDFLWVLTELVRADLENHRAAGVPARLADYRAEYPELFTDPAVVRALAAEEFDARRACGEDPDPAEYRASLGVGGSAFAVPGLSETPPPMARLDLARPAPAAADERTQAIWVAPVADRASARSTDLPPTGVAPDSTPPCPVRFPQVGDAFLGFRLVGELGRGAFARVFLAEQTGLSNRQVALKVTARPTREPQRLAKLRHTNIVPIHSVHDAPPLQAVCMPYLGRQTLADLIREYRETGSVCVSGAASTVAAARTTAKSAPAPAPAADPVPPAGPEDAPVRHALAQLSHPELVLWVMARLADGLAHAHDRGILHLDLKPANILFADDGQPLLLDFNLAFDVRAGDRERAGGTLPYMAPEQLEEYRDRGPTRVDHRTDLYALGVIFFELLTGRHPFPAPRGGADLTAMAADRRAGPPSVRWLNPAVTPAVEAVVHKLLHPTPARRYQSARDLVTDLERHRHHLPLRFAADPSLRERAAKWRRRHPRALLVLLLGGAVLAAGGLGTAVYAQTQARASADAAAQAREVRAALTRLRVDLTTRDDAGGRAAGLARGRDLLARYGLPDRPDWANGPGVERLAPADRAALADDLGELALLMAHAEWLGGRNRTPDERGAAADRALVWNRAAGWCFAGRPAPGALADQRRVLCEDAGRPWEADALPPAGEPGSSCDFYLRAAQRMARGKFADAVPLLEELTARDTGHYGGHFALAVCRHELADWPAALERYKVARALAPDDPRPAFNRGLIFLLHRPDPKAAAAEFTDAVGRDPGHAESYKHRAFARQWTDPRGALDDLARALELGAAPIQVHIARAKVYARLKEHESAARAWAAADALEPVSEVDYVARGNGRVERRRPAEALADFETAAGLNPNYVPAWQNQAHVLADHLDQPAKALAAQDRAVELVPDFAAARVGRAVLLARLGRRAEAHAEAQRALVLSAEPVVTYQAACVYAITAATTPADEGRAVDLFRKSLREGFRHFALIEGDADLTTIRDRPEFRDALAAARELVK